MRDASLLAIYDSLGLALARSGAEDDISVALEDLSNAIVLIREAILNEISWHT